MEEWDVEKELRKQKIAKRNDLIQRSRYALGVVENKAVSYMLSKVRPDDEPGKIYRFYFSEFYAVINWSKQSYLDLKNLLQDIADKSIWISPEKGKETLVRWFDIVDTDITGVGYFEISFHKRIQPFIYALQRQKEEEGLYYTTYELQNISLMSRQYSPRIYELLKSFGNRKTWIFEIGTGSKNDLQLLISDYDRKQKVFRIPAGWSNYAIFNRDVLKPAMQEINEYTDIAIEYTPRKIDLSGRKYRKYVAVEFRLREKTRGEKETAEQIIDAEYQKKAESRIYHQYTLEEQHGEDVAEEIIEENDGTAGEEINRSEEMIFSEPESLLESEFKEFSKQEIKNLRHMAEQKIIPGTIRFTKRELWLCDYIAHYKDWIDATPSDTRTTVYKRLLDCVRNDYDGIVPELTARYEYDYDSDQYNGLESYIESMNQISKKGE